MNPLKKIEEFGQAIWLDDIHRDLMTGGKLKRLIHEDGLRGMTSNPTIFKKAITGSEDYEEDIKRMQSEDLDVREIMLGLTTKDVRMAADEFRPVFESSEGRHGYVSFEVDPHLAYDTEKTIAEARRLWRDLDRPNVFIKVPGTRDGLPAIRQLIQEGININVTLLFGLSRYREVAQAYLEGIEHRIREGKPVDGVRSVASFFLSRIDVLLDPQLEAIVKEGSAAAALADSLRGQVAIASAKRAYAIYLENLGTSRWKQAAAAGANPQWLLWASTSTKNPEESDVKYVEALIGRDTVNTLPMETLEAYRDHGEPESRLEDEIEDAQTTLDQLSETGIDLEAATSRLEKEGVKKFEDGYDGLLEALDKKLAAH